MRNKILYALLLAFSLTSCEKMVEVEPKNQLSPNIVLSDLRGMTAVLNSAYDRLQVFSYWGRDMALRGDALADNIYTVPALDAGRYASANVNNIGQYNLWSNAYSAINDLNTVIASIDALTVPASQTTEKATVKAEALALRGMIYFDLARVYGYDPGAIPTSGPGSGFNKSVVLRLTPTGSAADAGAVERSTIEQTYAAIETDFKNAIATFPNNGTTRFRINKGATYGLLGKLYLYWRKYPEAVAQFDLALSNTSAVLTNNIVTAFTSAGANPESLFELTWVAATEMAGVTGSNESLFSYTNPKGRNGFSTFGGNTVSNELFALFEPTDARLGLVFQYGGTSASSTPIYNWSSKYSGADGTYTDNISIIRYADVLLMKAEALAAQTQYGPSSIIVNQIRTARSASATAPATAALVSFIQDERRRELFFEGHRFFDLKRLGNGITKPAKTAVGTIANTDFRLLAAIPVSEVTLLATLPQNPGY
jgi:starch-binding outer membrane protein, SusD/RagB family